MWGDVLKMKDDVKVEYDKLEEMFAQKTPTIAEVPQDDKVLRRQSTSSEVDLQPNLSLEIRFISLHS